MVQCSENLLPLGSSSSIDNSMTSASELVDPIIATTPISISLATASALSDDQCDFCFPSAGAVSHHSIPFNSLNTTLINSVSSSSSVRTSDSTTSLTSASISLWCSCSSSICSLLGPFFLLFSSCLQPFSWLPLHVRSLFLSFFSFFFPCLFLPFSLLSSFSLSKDRISELVSTRALVFTRLLLDFNLKLGATGNTRGLHQKLTHNAAWIWCWRKIRSLTGSRRWWRTFITIWWSAQGCWGVA